MAETKEMDRPDPLGLRPCFGVVGLAVLPGGDYIATDICWLGDLERLGRKIEDWFPGLARVLHNFLHRLFWCDTDTPLRGDNNNKVVGLIVILRGMSSSVCQTCKDYDGETNE